MLLQEQEFYDYKTAPVVGKDVIDLHRTGISYYDDFLSRDTYTLNYLKNEKNLVGTVVKMSPDEYYQACSEYGFINSNPSVEKLKLERRRDEKTIQHLKDVLTIFKRRFPMPMLNKAANSQEGLHRMMVIGDMFGWDYKVPVLIVDWADKQKAYEAAKRKRIERIEYNIKRAVVDALLYKFTNIDELKEQIQWELDKQFEYSSDIDTPVQFQLSYDEQNKEFTVTIGAATYSFDYDDVQFIDPSDEDDLDDLDFEVDDDFLVRYFGDDWRETYPHLKDKFNIKENLSEDFSNNNEFLHSLLDELSEFDYAFIGANGEELDDEEAMNAVVQHTDQFNRLRKGVCTDFVEYTSEKLSEHNIDHDVYFIKCVDKDGDEPSHVFVVVEDKGKFLWVEAAWHSEAGIHKYSSLEKLFEDIARKHCVYEGHNYLKSCEIRKIKKSLAGMSQRAIYDYVDTLPVTWKAAEEGITEELETTQVTNIEAMDRAIQEEFGQDKPGEGSIFIHPSGKFINIYPKLDDHEDLAYWLQEQGFENVIEEAEWFVEAFSYVRCRNSLSQCYVELPLNNITRYQLYSLEEWLETKVGTPTLDIEAPNGEWKNYDLNDYFPEDIIKIIKRYYAAGRLYESVEKEPELYCISQKDLDGQTLEPRIPDNFFTKNGYEDRKTPRVCFAPTIDQCLMAISQRCEGIEFYVFTPDNVPKESIYKPTVKEVPDSRITGETWITCPVKLKKVGKIKVLGDSGLDGHPFNYGNKTAELYDWDWEWIEK